VTPFPTGTIDMITASGGKGLHISWLNPLLLVLLGTGCSPHLGCVSGTVLYNNQPLPSGTVLFVGPDGSRRGFSPIAADGTYRVEKVPVGAVKIAVVSEPRVPPGLMKPPGPGAQPPDRKANDHVLIPARYNDPEHSGLTCTVEGGRQTQDILLQP
jgi:hypothetical protein